MKLKNLKGKYFLDIFIVSLIFFLDRVSKIIVININGNNFSNEIFSSKFLNIYLIWNKGIAFGLFSFDENFLYNFVTFLIIFICIILFFMILSNIGLKRYFLLMVFGGALGNLYDRIYFRAVPDFIDLHIENLHWFVFNIADIFITLGVFMLILLEIFFSKKKHEKT
tara:strand:- start:435 stop:935 length:501 start_codon:yes stop_codon:yes gene_type:complete